MKKEDLLKSIAETGYNIGFGAKKHFATYDIVAKVPGIIGFTSIAVGIFALFLDFLSTKYLSAAFIVFGVMGLCISHYDHKKNNYEEVGKELTQLFNKLKALYFHAKTAEISDFSSFENELANIEQDYYAKAISEQILFSDWYAHYKFFWQQQIDWIKEQKQFSFFRDMIPLSLLITVIVFLVCASTLVIWYALGYIECL